MEATTREKLLRLKGKYKYDTPGALKPSDIDELITAVDSLVAGVGAPVLGTAINTEYPAGKITHNGVDVDLFYVKMQEKKEVGNNGISLNFPGAGNGVKPQALISVNMYTGVSEIAGFPTLFYSQKGSDELSAGTTWHISIDADENGFNEGMYVNADAADLGKTFIADVYYIK